jgi:hypothetical protein
MSRAEASHWLEQAKAWGYTGSADSLKEAVERLRNACRSDPADAWLDPQQRATEADRRQRCRDLANQLQTILAAGITQTDEAQPMKISEAFPSSYLKASDLQGRAVRVTIEGCRLAHLDDESKPALSFRGKKAELLIDKTNAGVLAAALGDETDEWVGREIELYPDRVMFSGRMVDAIRVRVPQPAPTQQQPTEEIPW